MAKETYFELKTRKAEEQGKTWWYEAILTDEEARVRTIEPSVVSCGTCKFLPKAPIREDSRCRCEHKVTLPIRERVCDEWRYFA